MSTPTAAQEPPPDVTDVLDDPSAGSRAIRGAGVRTAGFVLGSLLTLASAPLLVRHLGAERFGEYTTVIALLAIVAGVTDAGLTALALREYTVRTGADRAGFMRSVLGARIALTTGGVVVATAFAAGVGYGEERVLGTVVAGVGLLIAVFAGTIGMPLAAGLRLGWVTVIDVGVKAVTVGLVIALILASADIVALLAVGIPAGLLNLVLVARLVRGQVPMRPSLRVAELAALMRSTLPLSVATVLSTFYSRIVIIVMSLIAADLTTGHFSVASRVIEAAVGIPMALVVTTFPILARAARDDHERLRYVLQRVFEVALIGGVWMALCTALAADSIITIVDPSPDMAPAIAPLQILAFALVPIFLNAGWQHGLLALHRHRDLLVANLCGLVAVTSLVLVLVPPLGARGAAVAVLGGELVLVLASGGLLVRGHPRLRPEGAIVWRVGAAAALSGAVAWATAALPGAGVLVIATAAYFGVLLALKAIPRELLDAVRSRWRPASS